jgi:transglutaminase-like putative cysteine protease
LFLRILTASLLCALLAAGIWWFEQPSSPEARLAQSLLGEHWYSLSLDGRHLGYWHTHNHRDGSGNWVFESEQRFAMNGQEPVSTRVRRTFAAAPPHALVAAEHLETRGGSTHGVRIEADGEGYRARRLPDDGAPTWPLSWQYRLADYLEFELWLANDHPAAGATRTVETLDFERTELVSRSFDVVASGAPGYVIENAAPHAATRIELDDRFVPTDMRIAGLFDLHRTTRADALAPRSTLQAASYYIPADRRLPDHTRIARLVLAIHGNGNPGALFPAAREQAGTWRLVLNGGSASHGPSSPPDLAETVQIPARHPRIAALAEVAARNADDPQDVVAALTEFVHGYLRYEPGAPSRDVLSLLDDPRGDCTEFADLLTTLARSLGLPARTVFGLAYADGPPPAFAYHAWNEIHVAGAWMAVDPTWGQLRLDATHIPLPQDETAALTLLTGGARLRFEVLDVAYFAD